MIPVGKDFQCSVDGCPRGAAVRGLCLPHYKRLRRHGDPTAGRTPDGVALRFLEDVLRAPPSSDCILWPFARDNIGYGTATMAPGVRQRVHVVVCEARNGPRPLRADAAHSCGVRLCCNPAHLRWATRVENMADRVQHGTDNRGVRNHSTKLTEEQVRLIRRLAPTSTHADLARRFGVSRVTISDAATGRTWGWLR